MASFHLKFYSQVRNIHSLYTFCSNLKYTNSIGFKVVMRYSIPPTITDHSDKTPEAKKCLCNFNYIGLRPIW